MQGTSGWRFRDHELMLHQIEMETVETADRYAS